VNLSESKVSACPGQVQHGYSGARAYNGVESPVNVIVMFLLFQLCLLASCACSDLGLSANIPVSPGSPRDLQETGGSSSTGESRPSRFSSRAVQSFGGIQSLSPTNTVRDSENTEMVSRNDPEEYQQNLTEPESNASAFITTSNTPIIPAVSDNGSASGSIEGRNRSENVIVHVNVAIGFLGDPSDLQHMHMFSSMLGALMHLQRFEGIMVLEAALIPIESRQPLQIEPISEDNQHRDGICSICLCRLSDTELPDLCQIISCSHAFHTECLVRRKAVKEECPVCRG
jgi:hypothetical protein